jgi:hypothetical protein
MRWVFILMILAIRAHAATINATGVTRSEVNTAITTAVNGDTVVIPPGSETWTSAIVVGTKAITIQGAGIGLTNITSNIAGSQTHLFEFTTHATIPTRFTGISFVGGSYDHRMFRVDHSVGTQCWRVDHCSFTASESAIFLDLYGDGPGLIDHCTFTSPDNTEFIHLFGNGAAGWTDNVTPGGPNSIYIEDNTFTNSNTGALFFGSSAIQSFLGARTVFRHNSLDFVQVDQHGTAGDIGARWWEIYENTFNIPARGASGGQDKYMDIRAGSGVIFNNHTTGASSNAKIVLREEDTGYPALYQVGRGINQNLSPAYLWGNDATMPVVGSNDVLLDRDFFVSTSQPSNMVRWQLTTDTGSTTYNYSPYTYPHPVQTSDSSSGSSIETVQVTNLKITGPAVSLAWDAVTQVAVDGYRIYYGPTSGQESIALDVGNVTTGEVKNLPPGVRIYFVLRAYKGLVESLPSNEVSYVKPVPTQMPTPTPAPPTPDPTLTPQPTPTPYLPLVTPQPIPLDPRLQRLQQRQQRQLWRQQRRQQWREQWRQNRGD